MYRRPREHHHAELFRRWPDPAALARAPQEELEDVIHAAGFYHSKAKNLIGAAKRVVEAYGGEVPHTLEELVTLPGVARKTANVVLWGGSASTRGLPWTRTSSACPSDSP